MSYALRDYQTAAAAAILRALSERRDSRPVAVLPTGAGKSLVLAEVARAAVEDWHGRVLVLAHVKELLQQNAEKLRALLPPTVAVGVHSAGLKRRDTDEPVVVAGVQSAVRRAGEFGKVNLAIVDECFPAGTEIETPAGPCRIEDAFVGQAVYNAAGVGRVEAISVRPTWTLCKLELEDGTIIECTPNHRFFTESGWCKAGALAVGARVFCREEVSDMRNRVSSEDIPGRARETDQVRGGEPLEPARLLFAGMSVERTKEAEAAKAAEAGSTTESVNVERAGENGEESLPMLRNGVSAAILRREAGRQGIVESSEVLLDPMREADGESGVRERGQNARSDSAKVEGRQRPEHAGSTESDVGDSFGHGGRGASNRHDNGAARVRTSARAEAGHCDPVDEDCRRTGRQVAQGGEGSRGGQAEERRPRGTRVVRIETVELFRPVPVFNLQVSGSPTYFAGGVLVHNCHLIPPEGEGMYRSLFEELRKENPGLRVAGFTATPFRLGHGLIYGGDENIFTEKCYEVGVRELIERGYLSPLVSRTHDAGAKLSGLHMRGGEFVAEEAEAAMRAEGVTDSIASDAAEKARGRSAALVFAAGVAHARELAEALANASGERAEVLTGETPPEERARLLAAFRGEVARDLFGSELDKPLKWLVNVGVLTTGFDAPNCDCVVLARATASTGLYVQMVGRGFRRSPETGKENCVAEGTKILTDRGLVPVENITKEMKLWDGVEFVRHEGAVCKGKQNAIEYAGLVATPDHKVWTGSGWRTFGECAELGLPISCTGIEGTTIREADRCFRFGSRCAQARLKKPLAKVRSDEVRMRPARLEVSGQPYEGRCRLSVVRTTEARAEMARQQGDQCEGSLRKSKEQDVQEIRRSRHSFLFPRTNRDGCVDYGEFGELGRQNEADRPNRQQRKLRAWEPANGNRAAERAESSFSSDTGGVAVSATPSGNPVCGLYFDSPTWRRSDGRGNHHSIPSTVLQTKRRVWDILNAGPRHRFTANGLLVSNCLILDYGDNILRHGPVDAPEAFAGGGPNAGAVAWKRCPVCEAAVPTGALKCHACGHEWPPRTREIGAGLAGSASGRSILTEDTEPVDEEDDVTAEYWEVHAKRNAPPDAPRTVQITYYCGPGRRFREWLCPEHQGFARRRSEKVWAERVAAWAPDRTMPASAEECVAAWERGEVMHAATVRLSREAGEKYIRAEAGELMDAPPPPEAEPTEDRGDAWEPPEAGAGAPAAEPASPDWDADELPF